MPSVVSMPPNIITAAFDTTSSAVREPAASRSAGACSSASAHVAVEVAHRRAGVGARRARRECGDGGDDVGVPAAAPSRGRGRRARAPRRRRRPTAGPRAPAAGRPSRPRVRGRSRSAVRPLDLRAVPLDDLARAERRARTRRGGGGARRRRATASTARRPARSVNRGSSTVKVGRVAQHPQRGRVAGDEPAGQRVDPGQRAGRAQPRKKRVGIGAGEVGKQRVGHHRGA